MFTTKRSLQLVALAMCVVGSVRVAPAAASGTTSAFCTPARAIADQVAKPALSIATQEQTVLIRTLQRTAKHAPRNVARAMKALAGVYKAVSKAASDADRAKVAYAAAVKFQNAQRVFADYYSTHCSTPPVKSPNLPAVDGANQAACLADMRALQIAETEYSAVNGEFGTMGQLVAAGFVKSPSVYHPEITVGNPPGGYTIVGNQGCNNVPVAG